MAVQSGLLAVWNAIVPEHDADFNDWYDSEHLDERLALPGFRTARRYRSLDDPHRYAALYELDGAGVLASPAYRAVLANPSARTRAIMPHFRAVFRSGCVVAFDSAPGAGAFRQLAILTLGHPADDAVRRAADGRRARLRLAVPDADVTGGATPEQALRASADCLPPPFAIVEADSAADIDEAVSVLRAATAIESERRFELIVDRPAPPRSLPADNLPIAPPGRQFALLTGIRVLDLTTSIAGPYCTMLLADMGAEVIKVERPGTGDDARAWGPPFLAEQSLWFAAVNRSKRSITLDYSTEAGAAVLRDLVRRSDVLVANLVRRAQAKLGVDAATLAALKPDLVHASITGFGLDGERADRPCYDLIAEGYSGVMDLTGEADGPPQKVGTPAADLLAGMDAAYAVVCALFDRMRTGRGHAIDIAMAESVTRFMAPRLVPFLGSGELQRRSGAKDSVIAIYQVFDTADATMTLGLGNDAIWKRFWQAVGKPERGNDPRLATNAARRAARAEIVADIQAILKERPRDHWLALFAAASVPAGPIYRADEVTRDAALLARGLFYAIDDGGTRMPQVGLGIHVDGRAGYHSSPPPRLGADTAAVLRELLGYDAARIEALKACNTI